MHNLQRLFRSYCVLKLKEFWKNKRLRLITIIVTLYLLPSACSNIAAFKAAAYDWRIDEYPSPDGKYIASVHRNSGGVLGDWSTYVVLRSSKYPFLKRCVYKVSHSPACSVYWTDESKLYVERTRIYPVGIWVHSSRGEGHL